MKILFLCQYFPPEMGAPAARTHEHARHWAQQGHDVTVVCGIPNHPNGIVPEQYRGTPLYRETIDGIRVLRCWLYATPNKGVLLRSLSFATFMFSAIFFAVVAAPKCDVVVATSPQLLCGLAGYIVAFLKRRPFVLEVRDLWPRQIVDLGVVKNKWVIRLLTGIEMFLYRRAKGIVTVAEATTGEIASRGVPLKKLHTITNGIDEEFFTPQNRMVHLRELGAWGESIVVMYVGTHGLSQGLSTILETADLLRSNPNIRFVFVGSGAEREMLIEKAREMYLDNVDFLPMQPKEKMPECYAAADICLVPLKKRAVFLYNIPSKIFEIMACARPIVLGVEGQAKEVVEEAGAGITVEPENPKAFAEAITRLAEDEDLRCDYGEQGRAFAITHYSRRQKAEKYLNCLQEILDRTK
ncbi:MAG TPA: glycosyltransferase family 4 protein [Candidatus Hydrogenedentes bacterium]|nr:glycosyltransferase family 4 protein [Candidatus Hydrogenedentota bacterium]